MLLKTSSWQSNINYYKESSNNNARGLLMAGGGEYNAGLLER